MNVLAALLMLAAAVVLAVGLLLWGVAVASGFILAAQTIVEYLNSRERKNG